MADMAREQIKRFGQRARERRDELGLTQREVAARMTDFPNVNNQYVSDWERAVHQPDPEHLEPYARALETTVADLWAGPVADRELKPEETPDLMAELGVSDNDLLGALNKIHHLLQKLDRRLGQLEQRGEDNRGELERMLTLLLGHFDLLAAHQELDQQEQATRKSASGKTRREAA